MKIAWGITGSGDRLIESVNTMQHLQRKYDLDIDVIVSKAGETVLTWYKLSDVIQKDFKKVFIERTPNTPFLMGPLQLGKYDFLLLCPATANTTAKIAYGIADSLLTNCVAQATKAGLPTFIFPVDQKAGEVKTVLPNKKTITLQMRDIDLENVDRLRRMRNITVLSNPAAIEPVILQALKNKGPP
ncbi:MAG: archaeoflavoprotein AfpA [Candidatus Bathyarchaeota archaeon]|nr:MAG: archaeoflavoprotein AfpA [Candidatus Bathyarchaeota archaeon]